MAQFNSSDVEFSDDHEPEFAHAGKSSIAAIAEIE